jgi:hypothetical protein
MLSFGILRFLAHILVQLIVKFLMLFIIKVNLVATVVNISWYRVYDTSDEFIWLITLWWFTWRSIKILIYLRTYWISNCLWKWCFCLLLWHVFISWLNWLDSSLLLIRIGVIRNWVIVLFKQLLDAFILIECYLIVQLLYM